MTNDTMPSTRLVDVETLKFDLENPRLFDGETRIQTEEDAIAALDETADLGELLESIAANGYIDIEPLLVDTNSSVVYEGNRRLAALRLLREPELAATIGISVPQIAEDKKSSLEKVTVYFVSDRHTARAFIGFKHINGPHRWDSYPKAKFATNWYLKEQPKITIREIAKKLGDRHDVVRRLVNGMLVLIQAQQEKIFDVRDRASGRVFYFSHLYTAITRPGFRAYLGLPDDWRNSEPLPNPVSPEKLENLKRVLQWLYGSKQDECDPLVTSQNPHVKQLDEIIRVPQARQNLEANASRVEAYKLVRTPATAFEQALVQANQKTEEALSKVRAYDGTETLFATGKSLAENANILIEVMTGRQKTAPAEV